MPMKPLHKMSDHACAIFVLTLPQCTHMDQTSRSSVNKMSDRADHEAL
jgi:hypothetical protein